VYKTPSPIRTTMYTSISTRIERKKIAARAMIATHTHRAKRQPNTTQLYLSSPIL
jgi:hypothetical protein